MITSLHHSDYSLKNRAFNCRMRNRYYEEVFYAFRSLMPNETANDDVSWYQHLSAEIERDAKLINTCLEYAQAAVYYGKADHATLYSKDKRWGILQEEVFLVHFLQELHSTTQYMSSRIETDKMLKQLSGVMQDKMTKPAGTGFVNTIQEKLDAMTAQTIKEFKDLLKHVMERFQIGNNLFGTVQELQNFY